MKKLLILTEAGKDIGYGHYVRCSAIQTYVESQRINTYMLLYVKGDVSFEVNGVVCNWVTDKEIVKKYRDYDCVLIDSYLAYEGHYQLFKSLFKKVVVLDDYNRISYSADLLINPNAYYKKIDYSNQKGKTVGGKGFVIMREAFLQDEKPSNVSDVTNHLLITLGGTDFRNLLPTIINLSLKTNIFRITVVSPEPINVDIDLQRVQIVGRQSAEEMYRLYKEADLVISGCGQTLNELATMGKPTIGVCLDIDQKPNQAYFHEKGFLLELINWNDKGLEENLLNQINQFQNLLVRKLVAQSAPQLVGKNGIKNIFNALIDDFTFSFRLAKEIDCLLYFKWANDPLVRKNAFNPEKIDLEDHKKWFSNKISSDSLLLVFIMQNKEVGQIRVDWERSGIGIIDFSIDSNFRGKGLSSKMLSDFTSLYARTKPKCRLKGVVKQENVASNKAFEKAGFSLVNVENVQSFPCFIYEYKI